jgi:hypothetical protein
METIMTTLQQTVTGGLQGLVTELKLLVKNDDNSEDNMFIKNFVKFLDIYILDI